MSGVAWRMRAALALQVAAAALFGWLGNGVFGGGLYGWLAALGNPPALGPAWSPCSPLSSR